ncbi:hypothetical protein GGU11DRAFT_756505 [Lentinula aff. detonsa]|nr:hypothetical protein GGU11DRAFT_756505 [Lentinula aff. detonsa]
MYLERTTPTPNIPETKPELRKKQYKLSYLGKSPHKKWRGEFGSGSTSPWMENDTIEAFLAEGAGCSVLFGWLFTGHYTTLGTLDGQSARVKRGKGRTRYEERKWEMPWNSQGENPMEDDDGGRPPDALPLPPLRIICVLLRFPKAPMDEIDELRVSVCYELTETWKDVGFKSELEPGWMNRGINSKWRDFEVAMGKKEGKELEAERLSKVGFSVHPGKDCRGRGVLVVRNEVESKIYRGTRSHEKNNLSINFSFASCGVGQLLTSSNSNIRKKESFGVLAG